MKLEKITIQNIKGITAKHVLGAENLIIGRNFTGKTARLQAIQLLLLGYIPGLPRTNPGIFQLASGRDMSVEGWGTENYHVHRSLEREGQKISRADSPIGLEETAEPMVAMMDASAFLAATAPAKLDMIFRLAQVETAETIATLQARCGALEWDIACDARTHHLAPVRDWIAVALPYAQDQRKYAKAHLDRLAKTQQGMESLQADQDANPLPDDVDGQINALEAARKPLEARQTELSTLKRSAESALEQYNRALSALGAEKQARQAKQEKLSIRPEVLRRIQEMEGLIAQHGDPEVERKRGIWMVARDAHAELESKFSAATSQRQDATAELRGLGDLRCCPFCKSKGTKWKAELESTYTAKRDSAQAAMEQLKPELDKAYAAKVQALTTLESAQKVELSLAGYRTDLMTQKSVLERLEQFERDLAVPLAEPQKPKQADDTVEEEMQLDQQLEGIEEQLTILRTAKQASDQRKARAATVAQAQLAAQEASDQKKLWDNAVEVLEEARANMVQAAFTTLLQAATPVYQGILETPLVFQGGQLGRMTNAGTDFIPLSAFSGTEMLVATIALQVALGMNSPAKIALLDELGKMDSENKSQLVKNLHGMIERGELHQWIAVDVTPQVKLPKFITLISA